MNYGTTLARGRASVQNHRGKRALPSSKSAKPRPEVQEDIVLGFAPRMTSSGRTARRVRTRTLPSPDNSPLGGRGAL
jgi:hypothetical protein